MENTELFDEIFDEVFETEYEVNAEMDEVNPWMMIASESGSTSRSG